MKISLLQEIARFAGKAILKIYEDEDFNSVVDFKADNSPLTLADKASHEVIMAGLKKEFPGIPVISEEGKDIPFDTRKEWKTYFLVDPLDGTKEFINRNGEFTVNIALIQDQKPVVGVVYVPVKDVMYIGTEDGAFKEMGTEKVKINVNKNKDGEKTAVRSKSHASPEEDSILKEYNATKSISVGSSLKFCMVAEGKADIYYRHGPTMEWDTAAGQAVVEAAGGQVFKETGPDLFKYNKSSLLNPGFLCLGWS